MALGQIRDMTSTHDAQGALVLFILDQNKLLCQNYFHLCTDVKDINIIVSLLKCWLKSSSPFYRLWGSCSNVEHFPVQGI